MNDSKFDSFIQQCTLEQLIAISKKIAERIHFLEKNPSSDSEEALRQKRTEERFEANILGNLTRITDIRPNEKREYSVTIKDISRSGMCLKVDTNFIPSRLVEVTFAGPGGKIKRCHLEIVRMKKLVDQDGTWLEVGCRSATDASVRQARLQEEQIAKMRTKLYKKRGIQIAVIGPDNKDTETFANRIKSQDYQVRKMTNCKPLLEKNSSFNLAIFWNGNEILSDDALQAEIASKPQSLATLAIVTNLADRFPLFQLGIDECLLENQIEEFLFHTIERAIVGHTIRNQTFIEATASAALILTDINSRINLLTYQLEEQGFPCQTAPTHNLPDADQAKQIRLVFADFETDDIDGFKTITRHFHQVPVIAICDTLDAGHLALAHGAVNYLCMPPNPDDIRMILQSCAKHESAAK